MGEEMLFDEVSVTMIGAGGTARDRTLIQRIDEEIQRLSQIVLETDRDQKATITIKLVIKAVSERTIAIEPTMTTTEPKHGIRGLSAVVTRDGQVLASEQRQMPIEFDANVAPIKKPGTN